MENFANAGAAAAAIATALGKTNRPAHGATHALPAKFTPGTALTLSITADAGTTAAKMYYRHVNQVEAWQSAAMTSSGSAKPEGVHSIAALENLAVLQQGHAVEVRYSLNRNATVSGHLHDYACRLVASFNDKNEKAGAKVKLLHPVIGMLSSGEYVLKLAAEGSSISKSIFIQN